MTRKLWLVGCGNMGGALLARWQAAGDYAISVIDPARGSPTAPAGTPDIIVLAVKPQAWRDAAAPFAGTRALVVSVMAGVRTASLAEALPDACIVRTIPNTPARLGQGVTALYAARAGTADKAAAEALMAGAGTCVWLDDESGFDAVTAVSGSGPAYVFAFIEALAAAGVAAGLPPRLADELALRTVTGAASLAAEPGADPATLRAAVTSTGGTTAAGLAVLQAELPELLRATVAAAQSRSRELGQLE